MFKPEEITKKSKLDRFFFSKKDPMLDTLYLHKAWKGSIDVFHSEHILKNGPPFTYLLRQGASTYEFFISYVEESESIKHVPFKLELTIRKWSYKNGTGIISDDLENFIPLVIHCKKSACLPLS
jgi:hypothetical protein